MVRLALEQCFYQLCFPTVFRKRHIPNFYSTVFLECISQLYLSNAYPQCSLNRIYQMYFPTISIICIPPLITQPNFSNVFLTVFFKCISSIYNSTITLQFISKETRGFDWHLSNAFVKFISQLYFSDVFLNCIF